MPKIPFTRMRYVCSMRNKETKEITSIHYVLEPYDNPYYKAKWEVICSKVDIYLATHKRVGKDGYFDFE